MSSKNVEDLANNFFYVKFIVHTHIFTDNYLSIAQRNRAENLQQALYSVVTTLAINTTQYSNLEFKILSFLTP